MIKSTFFGSVTYLLFLINPYTLLSITTWDFKVNFVSWCINPWGQETNKNFPTPVHLLTFFLKFPTIPAIPVNRISVTATAKETLHTIHKTQRNRQMKWCPPARIQKLFIVLHINHKQMEKPLIVLHKTCLLFPRLAVKTEYTKYARIHTLFNASSSSSEEESLCQTCQCNGKSERILSLEISGGEAHKMSFPPLAAIFALLSFFCTSAEHNFPPNWPSPTTGSSLCSTLTPLCTLTSLRSSNAAGFIVPSFACLSTLHVFLFYFILYLPIRYYSLNLPKNIVRFSHENVRMFFHWNACVTIL